MATITAPTSSLRTALRMGSLAIHAATSADAMVTPAVHLEAVRPRTLRVRSQWDQEQSIAYLELTEPVPHDWPAVALGVVSDAMLCALDAYTGRTVTLEADAARVRLHTPGVLEGGNIARYCPVPDGPGPAMPAEHSLTSRGRPTGPVVTWGTPADPGPGVSVQFRVPTGVMVQFYGQDGAPNHLGWAAGLWSYGRALPTGPAGPSAWQNADGTTSIALTALTSTPRR